MMRGHDVLAKVDRVTRRQLLADEARRRRTGDWGPWTHIAVPLGISERGWGAEVREIRKNEVFACLIRPIGLGHIHFTVSSLSQIRPTWREAQRLKNEIAGPDITAIEVYPPQEELVDEAHMFHFWTVDALPFTIFAGARP